MGSRRKEMGGREIRGQLGENTDKLSHWLHQSQNSWKEGEG